jgi:hypothetical protein
VQSLAGHANLATTSRYLHASQAELAQEVQKLAFHPPTPTVESQHLANKRPTNHATDCHELPSLSATLPVSDSQSSPVHVKICTVNSRNATVCDDLILRELREGKEAPPGFEPGIADLQSPEFGAQPPDPAAFPSNELAGVQPGSNLVLQLLQLLLKLPPEQQAAVRTLLQPAPVSPPRPPVP